MWLSRNLAELAEQEDTRMWSRNTMVVLDDNMHTLLDQILSSHFQYLWQATTPQHLMPCLLLYLEVVIQTQIRVIWRVVIFQRWVAVRMAMAFLWKGGNPWHSKRQSTQQSLSIKCACDFLVKVGPPPSLEWCSLWKRYPCLVHGMHLFLGILIAMAPAGSYGGVISILNVVIQTSMFRAWLCTHGEI